MTVKLWDSLEKREYGRRDPSRWPRGTLYPQKLTLTLQTGGDRSVGIVRSRTQTVGFAFFIILGIRHADHVALSNRKSWH
jgi:hypothetical protein